LPSFANARKLATHAESVDKRRAFVQSTEDSRLFGCALRVKAAPAPAAGDVLHLVKNGTGVVQRFVVRESTAIGPRMFMLALREEADPRG